MHHDEDNLNNWRTLFPHVKIQEAVIGKKVDITDTNIVAPLTRFQLNHHSKNDSIYAVPSVGGIGCYLSHLECMKKCISLNKPIIVIEEDVKFNEKSRSVITNALQDVPDDSKYVSLMYIRQNKNSKYNSTFCKILGDNSGFQCYLIFPEGAKIILKHALPITTQIDLFVGVLLHLYPEFIGYALDERLYSFSEIFMDNLSTDIQSFAVKKYLPSGNIFYVIVVLFIITLVSIIIYQNKNKNT
tara:strand:- start:11 stop:739 length:729 start_codon:yes stop_codon:yes gene_type:complete